MEAERVDLHVFGRDRFEAMLEGIPDDHWPDEGRSAPLNGLYLREGARDPLDPARGALIRGAIFLAVPSAKLPTWAEPEEILFEALAAAVHEHKHDPDEILRRNLEEAELGILLRHWDFRNRLRDFVADLEPDAAFGRFGAGDLDLGKGEVERP